MPGRLKRAWRGAGGVPVVRLTGPAVPSLDLLWSYASRPDSDVNVVKAARAAIVWREANAFGVVCIAVRYLRWFWLFPLLIARNLAVRGFRARKQFGRSLSGQFADMVRVAIVNDLMPRHYYLAALARCSGEAEILRYLPSPTFGTVVQRLSPDSASPDSIMDKLAFERRCRAAGLPVVRTVAIATAAELRSPEGDRLTGRLPDRDLVLKPRRGGQGRGIEAWRLRETDCFVGGNGQILSGASLATRALALSADRGCEILIQERIENHPALMRIAGSALATTRIVTMLDESGNPEIVDSFYRTSTHQGAAVDNFHAGGILFPIDIASGRLHPGLSDAAYGSTPIVCHPETSEVIAGSTHPGWQQMAELAIRLHRLFPDFVMPGWDIGFGSDGVVAVEGNDIPGISVNRQATFGGLVGTRAFALLAFHAAKWLDQNEPTTSRWRPPRVQPATRLRR